MHKFIKDLLTESFSVDRSEIYVLYGGSVKPDNARELFGMKNIDGGLVGGASLKAGDFLKICRA